MNSVTCTDQLMLNIADICTDRKTVRQTDDKSFEPTGRGHKGTKTAEKVSHFTCIVNRINPRTSTPKAFTLALLRAMGQSK